MTKNAEIWDEKSEFYPRYKENQNFENLILQKSKDFDVLYENSTILDVGCGTGIYTINLAKIAKKIFAIDFSKNMIEILNEDAKKFGVYDKIQTQISSFDDFKTDQKFDIVFSTMSPAIEGENLYQKAFNLAKNSFVYLGWAGKRENKIEEEIFEICGLKKRELKGANKLKIWLEKNNFPYKSEIFENSFTKEKTLEQMTQNLAWHIKISGHFPNIKLIEKYLKKYEIDGKISSKTLTKVELIVCNF